MKVVIVGAKTRNTNHDRVQVNELIDAAWAKYPNCLFVSTSHNEGVGKYVREKCLERTGAGLFKYQLALVNIQLYVSKLSRQEVTALYQTRIASLLEIGDIYYYLASENRTGVMEELIGRALAMNRPVKILLPGDPIELI